MKKHYKTYGYYCGLIVLLLFIGGCATSRKAERANQAAEEAKEKALKEKYAAKLGVDTQYVCNCKLYSFIDDWYGTPYHYAGRSKEGVDCSDFVSLLYQDTYGKTIGGTAGNIYELCNIISEDKLQEGDLVFFRINSKTISHVGVYLQNHKFVHASVHSGVVISDLQDAYYKKYFYKAGRPKV